MYVPELLMQARNLSFILTFFFSLTLFAVMFAITAQLPVFSIKNSSLLKNVKDMANYMFPLCI